MRILLATKVRYLAGMAGLFERYRRIELLRSQAISIAVERYATVVARVRGAPRGVGWMTGAPRESSGGEGKHHPVSVSQILHPSL